MDCIRELGFQQHPVITKLASEFVGAALNRNPVVKQIPLVIYHCDAESLFRPINVAAQPPDPGIPGLLDDGQGGGGAEGEDPDRHGGARAPDTLAVGDDGERTCSSIFDLVWCQLATAFFRQH
eukprot:5710930-Pyramimonas_sp.AAC.1